MFSAGAWASRGPLITLPQYSGFDTLDPYSISLLLLFPLSVRAGGRGRALGLEY